ncbi:hypothetical protein V5O48_008067 [Marasmius crinis-equi]|uniref:Uncharacterized protein n=1 Tax=Marasmius crinis-equi TaxID=585013 RepID=A0ABR3FEW6_9AGAR
MPYFKNASDFTAPNANFSTVGGNQTNDATKGSTQSESNKLPSSQSSSNPPVENAAPAGNQDVYEGNYFEDAKRFDTPNANFSSVRGDQNNRYSDSEGASSRTSNNRQSSQSSASSWQSGGGRRLGTLDQLSMDPARENSYQQSPVYVTSPTQTSGQGRRSAA